MTSEKYVYISLSQLMCNFFKMISSSKAIPDCLQFYLGKPDPRVQDWVLLNSPLNLVVVYTLYFITIVGGTRFMKNRQPPNLKNALIAYNCFQISFAVYICKEIFVTAYLAGYKLTCTPLDTSNSELALRMARAFWWFYTSKIIDLMDTVFFVLRKKASQLTFLHVYHHASMVTNWYLGVLYLPGGQAFFSAGVNSFVHVIMYTYYLLSAMGPKMQKYLWWKRYLTQVQLVQFIALMVHVVLGGRNGCNKPIWLKYFTIAYLWSLLFLFANFYTTTYRNKKKCKSVVPHPTYQKGDIDIGAGGDIKLD